MAAGSQILVGEQDVFSLTDKGSAELKACATSLSPAELAVLVLLDGRATVAQVVYSAGKPTLDEVGSIIRKLVRANLLTSASSTRSGGLEFGAGLAVPSGLFGTSVQSDPGVPSLEKQGYYVRIARLPPAKRELKEGEKLTVLVVDDDPDLNKLLRTYLMLEGFLAQTAANRDELIAALRQAPKPDLILLDVELPDADGFEILVKIRQHPALKTVPVIMLTAEASRGAVLKGLRAGVDGYVTKPFEPDALMMAVKSVLGLAGAAAASA